MILNINVFFLINSKDIGKKKQTYIDKVDIVPVFTLVETDRCMFSLQHIYKVNIGSF